MESESKNLVLAAVMSELAQQMVQEGVEFIGATLAEPIKGLTGFLVADKIHFLRWKNLVIIAVEAKRLLAKKGLPPEAVPLKIIHPLLELASFEEEPDVQRVWANLLANAADPRRLKPIRTMFVGILEDLGAK